MEKSEAKQLIEKLKTDNRFLYLENYQVTHILAIPEDPSTFHKWFKLYLMNEGNEEKVFLTLPNKQNINVYLIVSVDDFLLFENFKEIVKQKGILDYSEYF